MKRILVFLVCLMLLASAIPAGATAEDETMWRYVLGTDEYGGTYAILTGGKANFDSKTLTVPLILDGYLVREIGANAFQVFDEAEEIILHESIQRIGAYSFAGLPKLKRVVIPENGFLHHMVRIMVGTLLEVGRGERSAEDIPALFGADRALAGELVPSCGLCLMEVTY